MSLIPEGLLTFDEKGKDWIKRCFYFQDFKCQSCLSVFQVDFSLVYVKIDSFIIEYQCDHIPFAGLHN